MRWRIKFPVTKRLKIIKLKFLGSAEFSSSRRPLLGMPENLNFDAGRLAASGGG